MLHRVSQQDLAAFAFLYKRTSAKLNGIIRRILPEMTLADDVLQDVYVRIWRSAAGYDASRGRPITWMAVIARNLAIDVRRQETSRRLGQHILYEPDFGTQAPDIDPELGLALKCCLDLLEPVQRAMIIAAYCLGMSREELADHYNCPVGTVKSWLHRGLATLRAGLSDD